jgi:hypothetical protein
MGGIGDALAMIPMVIKFIMTLPQRFGNILTGLVNIFFGVAVELKDIGVISGIVLIDFFVFMEYTWEFVRTYTICSLYFLSNMTRCIFYYAIDIFGIILYLPIRLILYLVYVIGFDLYSIETQVWDGLEKLDTIIYGYTGVHIIHWPKSIRDQCYNCKRLKVNVYAGKIMNLVDDFTIKIPSIIVKGLPYLKASLNNLLQVFSSNPSMPNPLFPKSPF